ncbi:3-hydroxyindolin-2-one monooxygenase-like [Setaria viridis]|uniref:3-hydroxyindolin-2-one monooxygenase-like n=1 Tax=Setaria viridis TaxID=4556 RepID=UPI003B3B3712
MSDLLRKFTSDMVCHAVAGRSFRVEGRDRMFQDLIDEGMALLAGFNLEISYPGLAKAAVLECDLGQHQRLRARPPAPTNSAGAWRGWKPDCHIWKQFIHIYIKFFTRQGHLDPNQVKITSCFSIIYPNFDYRWHLKALNMFAAGTDTAYLVLEFAMAELMLHKEAMAKLQHEVREQHS